MIYLNIHHKVENLKVEVLVSTMRKKDYSFINEMKITGDCTIINQDNDNNFTSIQEKDRRIQFISYDEKGLSKSRNRGIEHASSDICIIADDSCIYVDNYIDIVSKSYQKHPDADLIIFDINNEDTARKERFISKKTSSIGYLKSMKVSSVRISFKKESIKKTELKFDTYFGSGSNYFSSGEENIFLFNCLKKNLNIIYVPILIGKIKKHESTWFKGYNADYFKTKGAVSYALFKKLYILYIMQFAIRKYKLYNNECSFTRAISYMLKGKSIYRNILKSN